MIDGAFAAIADGRHLPVITVASGALDRTTICRNGSGSVFLRRGEETRSA